MLSSFKAISLSHKNASIAIRERLALDEIATRTLLRKLSAYAEISDVLILSTCNRTEIYYCSATDMTGVVMETLLEQKHLLHEIDTYTSICTVLNNGAEAIQHLFRVAAGLESKEVGDAQIYQQVKKAYEWSVQENTAGTFLHRLLHTVFFAHKRMIQETSFWDGTASVSHAAVELAGLMASNIHQPVILVIGLGEMGIEICQYLSEFSQARILVPNRTFVKTAQVAQQYGFEPVPFEYIFEAIEKADIIISSIRVAQPLITKTSLRTEMRWQYQYFIDLSVPRSVETDLDELPNVVVYNIDEIHQQASFAMVKRLQAVPQVEQIIANCIEEFKDWAQELVVSPAISQLKNMLETIRQEELSRFAKKMNTSEFQLAEEITRNMMQKILKMPVLQLKAACKRGEADLLMKALEEIFRLPAQFQV